MSNKMFAAAALALLTFGVSSPLLALATMPATTSAPAGLVLKKGMRVAVVGDSITEQRMYSRNIELYLTACCPQLDLHVIQLGWSGETASGFAGRMANDLMWYKPDVVTTCYGMNDGGYGPFSERVAHRYTGPMRQIVQQLKHAGAVVVVGSPGVVDSTFFRGGREAPIYNSTLGKLREIARQIAQENGMPFADVHGVMMAAMQPAKDANGKDFNVGGRDGIHPGEAGHLLMAYAFLKAMGLDGQIGTITVDLKGQTTATEGHKIVSSKDGKVEIASSRYPYCFLSPDARAILPFVPFNRELNRFVLVVKNLETEKAKVTWGDKSQTYTREQLESGINLAEAFPHNPFCEPFKRVQDVVAAKEAFETQMIKGCITQFPALLRAMDNDAEARAALDTMRTKLAAKYERGNTQVHEAVKPVTHTITITPEK